MTQQILLTVHAKPPSEGLAAKVVLVTVVLVLAVVLLLMREGGTQKGQISRRKWCSLKVRVEQKIRVMKILTWNKVELKLYGMIVRDFALEHRQRIWRYKVTNGRLNFSSLNGRKKGASCKVSH